MVSVPANAKSCARWTGGDGKDVNIKAPFSAPASASCGRQV